MGCVSSQSNNSKPIQQALRTQTPPKQSNTQTSMKNPSTSDNNQKEQKTALKKQASKLVKNEAEDNSLAGRYRKALRSEVMGYVNDLPNRIFKAENSASNIIKTRRITMEIPKFADYLPCEHTNSIFVRVNETHINSMNILISGSSGTPYAHGLYHFEMFCDDGFPVSPPKMQLLTGNGKVRFNPNLYLSGYICLSLLGTWPGNQNQTWNPAKSSLFQIFISIQSLIMTDGVYFHQPGYQGLKNTPNGKLYNQGYCNVVKLANIRYAMIEMIKKPPKGFEKVVRKHFFIKKDEIIQECEKWLALKDRPFLNSNQNPSYQSLIATNGYGNLLEKQIKQLKQVLSTLEVQS